MSSFIFFPRLLQAEIYKTLRSKHIMMLVLSPLLISALLLLYVIFKNHAGLFNETILAYEGNPWLTFWSRYTLPLFSLLLPPIVITLSYIVCDMEFRNDNIRMLFAFPVTKWRLYLSKVSVIIILVAILIFTTWIAFVLGGYLLGYLIPAYQFAAHPIWTESLQVLLRILLASFSVGTFGLLVSLLSRSFTIPILLGCFLTALAVFVTNETVGEYLPFATFTYIASVRPIEELTTFGQRDIINILFGIIALLIGYISITPEKQL